MSEKRRRGIGIRKWLILAIQEYAKEHGLKSHTVTVSKILRGELKPIQSFEKYKNEKNDIKQGVSMQEELWLALKDYASNLHDKDARVAHKILIGEIGPIPKGSLKEGEKLARKREELRTLKKEESNSIELVQDQIVQDLESEPKKDADNRTLSKGVPIDQLKPEDKKINPDDDFYSGVFNI